MPWGLRERTKDGASQKVSLELRNEGVRFPLGHKGVFIASNTYHRSNCKAKARTLESRQGMRNHIALEQKQA